MTLGHLVSVTYFEFDPEQLERDIAEQAKKDATKGTMTYRMDAEELLLFQKFKEEQEEKKSKAAESKTILVEDGNKNGASSTDSDKQKQAEIGTNGPNIFPSEVTQGAPPDPDYPTIERQ